MMAANFWTPVETDTLEKAMAAGLSRVDIADLLPGRTPDAIYKRIRVQQLREKQRQVAGAETNPATQREDDPVAIGKDVCMKNDSPGLAKHGSEALWAATDTLYNVEARRRGCTPFQAAMWLMNGLRVDERGVLQAPAT